MDEDDDRSVGSQDAGSDNDADDTMRDVDGDVDGDADDDVDMEDNDNDNEDDEVDGEGDGEENDGEGDAEGEGEGENEDDGGDENDEPNAQAVDEAESSNERQSSQVNGSRTTADLSHPRPEVLTALTYDIVPTIAAPQSTSINSICGTSDSRWIFTGGSDGYIRQFNWVESVNGKTLLTVAQRHPFVDSVVKAGVMMTYWENYDARKMTPGSTTYTTITSLSPVYSLACQSQALWLLAGTASGAIRLQSVRHDEGREITLLQKHTSTVSVLTLASDEKRLLSGSWDKSIVDWDLNTGQIARVFETISSQVSCIDCRPVSSVPVPYESGEVIRPSDTLSTNNAANDVNRDDSYSQNGNGVRVPTPDSLFGDGDGDDDLFGDNADTTLNGNAFGFDDSEIQPNERQNAELIGNDSEPTTTAPAVKPPENTQIDPASPEPGPLINAPNSAPQILSNGIAHADELETSHAENGTPEAPITSDSIFMATSIDGSIRIWDRRAPLPVARITPVDAPPWCLSACWSPDGNNIYAGRRNNTVEEYDLRKGLKKPERVFRFQNGSGPVTSVRAMPNGRHLICASYDILRLYDLQHTATNKTATPFLIVPGHRTGTISHLYLSGDGRYMLSGGGNRGWDGQSTDVLLGYEIGVSN